MGAGGGGACWTRISFSSFPCLSPRKGKERGFTHSCLSERDQGLHHITGGPHSLTGQAPWGAWNQESATNSPTF